MRARPVLLDTDPGVDDALAILLALRSPELDMVGITTVCGNVSVEQATRNLLRVLNLGKPLRALLIGQGASRPLVRPLETAAHVHGADGLGDLDRFHHADGRLLYPIPEIPRALPTAQEVWEECAQRRREPLTLITLGPLTNLAVAIETNLALIRRFKSVICMAGAITVSGNVTPAAEFNMYVDPEAAQRVVQAGIPLTLIPLDVTTKVALNRKAILALTKAVDPICRFLRDATERALVYAEEAEGRALLPLHDPLAVAVAIDPSLVRCMPLHVTVETEGTATLGMTMADRRALRGIRKRTPNVEAALAVDAKRALRLIQERLCRK